MAISGWKRDVTRGNARAPSLIRGFVLSPSVGRPVIRGFVLSPSVGRPVIRGFVLSPSVGRPVIRGFVLSPSVGRPVIRGFVLSPSVGHPVIRGFVLSALLPSAVVPDSWNSLLSVFTRLVPNLPQCIRGRRLKLPARTTNFAGRDRKDESACLPRNTHS